MTIFLLLFLLTSCDSPSLPSAPWQELACRDEKPYGRYPVYRAKIPLSWHREDPASTTSIEDTTVCVTRFTVDDIQVSFHTFPSTSLDERIPPQAQVARWQRQFEHLDPTSAQTIPQAYGGFSGLRFEGVGIVKNQPTAVLGWAMQLSPENYQALQLPGSAEERHLFKQMRADYTIKAVGSPQAMQQHREEIIAFARSLGLIQEIP